MNRAISIERRNETFRRKLQEFATKDGVGTIEARVRAAIDKGNYAEANRLRTERQKLMLREAETLWRSIPGSSAERPPGKE